MNADGRRSRERPQFNPQAEVSFPETAKKGKWIEQEEAEHERLYMNLPIHPQDGIKTCLNFGEAIEPRAIKLGQDSK